MANNCMVEMAVYGRKENVDQLIQILQNDYSKTHMFRIFESSVWDEQEYGMCKRAYIFCDVAWSATSTMMPGRFSYFDSYIDDIRNHPEKYLDKGRGTNIVELSRELQLNVYIYSEEPGMAFSEKIHILDGEVLRDDCQDFHEIYIGDFSSYKVMQEECGYDDVTEEEFNNARESGSDFVVHLEEAYNPDYIPNEFPPQLEKRNIIRIIDKDNLSEDDKKRVETLKERYENRMKWNDLKI